MELPFAFLAGLLTLINPCVLPVLPIVLASSLQAGRAGPLVLAGGMALSFVVLGTLVWGFGRATGLSEEAVGRTGAVLMIGFGLVLLMPRLQTRFAAATAGLAAGADARIGAGPTGAESGVADLWRQAAGGALLGAVWSPCVGPTLGGAIALASRGESLPWAVTIMSAFAAGVATVIVAAGYTLRGLFQRHRARLNALAGRSHAIMGVAFVAVGAAILLRLHHIAEAWALDALPAWLTDLSVAF